MQLTEITFSGQPPIDAYGPGFFRVQNQVHQGPLLMLPDGPVEWAGFKDVKPLLLANPACDVLLIGTGEVIAQLPKTLRAKLEKAEIPFELMSSPSACRTYNVLLSEGRRVGIAALTV